MESICRIGGMIYDHYKKPCPALVWGENRYKCGLYLSDESRFAGILQIGSGCCYPFNPLREKLL